jgi:hydroxymethylbilane synthase
LADRTTLECLAALDDESTRRVVAAERAFLSGLGGGCAVPVAAYAEIVAHSPLPGIRLTGLVISTDGQKAIRVVDEGMDALGLGSELARQALSQGASQILALSEVQ